MGGKPRTAFFVTEGQLSSTVPRKSGPGSRDDEEPISILNFEERCTSNIPRFTEPYTIQAMYRLAIEPSMLSKPTEKDFQRFNQGTASRQQAEILLENRRKSFISQITAERERLMSAPRSRTVSVSEELSTTYDLDQKAALARIERMQKREIEQIVIAELIRARDKYRAEWLQSRQAAIRQQRDREAAAARARDAEDRARRNVQIQARVAEKTALMEQRRQQMDANSLRLQRVMAEKKAEDLKRASDADKERQARSQKLRLELDRRKAEEVKRQVAKMKAQEEREEFLLQRKAEAVEEVRRKNAEKTAETQRKFAEAKKRDLSASLERRKALETKSAEAEIRIEAITRERDSQIMGKVRAKSEAQMRRYAAANKELERERREKEAKMAEKNSQADMRKREIMEERETEIHAMEQKRLEKLKKAEAQITDLQKQKSEAGERAKEKWRTDDERAEEAKAKRESEIRDRAELQKLKEELQAESAAIVKKRREIHLKEKSEESGERQERAEIYMENLRELALRKRDEKTKLDFQKEAVISQFHEEMRKGGNVDVELLSKRYGLDLEELKKRVGA
jgi:hypothetical protein